MLTVIQSLLNLQMLDSRIRTIRKKIQRNEEESERYLRKQENDRKKLTDLKPMKEREMLALANKELELKGVEAKLDALKKKLYSGDITSSKELSQWEKNMEIFEKLKERLEEEIITQMVHVETFQVSFEEEVSRIKQQDSRVEHFLGQAQEELVVLTEELSGLTQERERVTSAIPAPVYREYDKLIQRITDPLAELVEETCGGCRLTVPLAIEKAARKEEGLIRCPNCSRFLYSKPKDSIYKSNRLYLKAGEGTFG